MDLAKLLLFHLRPDTFIYTTADSSGFILPQKGAFFVVESSGRIYWPNPLPQMQVRCRMSIAWVNYLLKILIYSSGCLQYFNLKYCQYLNHFQNLMHYQQRCSITFKIGD